MPRAVARIPVLLLVALVAAGCGYSFKQGKVREGLDSVAVSFFENRSGEPDIEVQLTEDVLQGLIADRTLRIADENVADAILYGIIRRYTFGENFYGSDRRAEEYRIEITVEIQLVDRRTGENIVGPEQVRGTANYALDEGPAGEEAARERATDMIIQGILALVIEEW